MKAHVKGLSAKSVLGKLRRYIERAAKRRGIGGHDGRQDHDQKESGPHAQRAAAKILIVEDNPELAWLLGERLKAEGYETRTAESGAAGIKAALTFLPDLMLLDYNLGDMTGHDVAVALRNTSKTARIPFLVLSAHGADPMLARGFAKLPNCRGSMSKVLSTKEVVKAVHRALPHGGKG